MAGEGTTRARASEDGAWELRHFRITSNVLFAVVLVLGLAGHFGERAWLLELGLALAVLAGGYRILLEAFPSLRPKLISLHPLHFFLDSWREIDAEAAAERAAQPAGAYDYRPLFALATGAVCLALMEYFGHEATFRNVLEACEPMRFGRPPETFCGEIRSGDFVELWIFVWWGLFRVGGYLLIPALVVKLGFRERLRDQGLETKGFLEHAWIYVLGYCVVFVCVIFVARNDENFQTYYPFYHQAGRSWLDFGAWELIYAAQFFSLEFFFRGFWLRAMKRQLGSYAIFAMVVPYCMIHFGKPFPETLAAIVAGLFLGTLSMKTRSIWSGFLIHVSVAISMDLASLAVAHDWPAQLLPPGF
ncbi:MAG: CPBP family intramembrane glutamic endopeptidase [Sandaracinus sp.]